MNKYLKKLPTEGLLIIVVILITLILVIYFTKIDSVIKSHNSIKIINVNEIDESKDALFISNNEIENEIILTQPEPVKEEEANDVLKKIRIFFIDVTDEGEIDLKSVIKNVNVGKSPLRKSIEKLLEGPDTQDMNRGLLTLIPDGAKLLSISIKDSTAYINFNEMFRFNPLGVEGYIAQIKQIVYTATEYESVKNVQFLIDGNIQEYLGPEGVYIGRPISRDDFDL
ncbi:MAG: GerMN domain-containing protein [Spirochaetales bacterium]|nr:GerMN domain-containing protein [Spirochaetales bacterium]